MGASDIVPGVSGGTIALILGIYERLIEALRSLARPPFLRSLARGRFRAAFAEADLGFLSVLVAGIATAVLALARLLEHLLQAVPALVYGFFFGLIVASVFVVAQRVERFTWGRRLLFAGAAVAAFLFVGLTPASTPDSGWFLFLSGALGISALLLPGVSGAFVLLLLGKYELVLSAVSRFDLGVLVPVGLGAVAGMLSITQVLGWLFRRFPDTTLAILAGLILGALRKVWPWQVETEGGATSYLRPPAEAFGEQGVVWVIVCAASGALAVLALAALEMHRARSNQG